MLHCSWYLQQEAWKVGFNSIPFDDFSVFSFREVSFCSTVLALSLSLIGRRNARIVAQSVRARKKETLPYISSWCREYKYYTQYSFVDRYVGSLSGLAYNYSLPCVVYMMIQKKKCELTIPSAVFHCLIVVFGIADFIAQFFIKVWLF